MFQRRDKLIKELLKKFPKGNFKNGEAFDGMYTGTIWTGEEAMVDTTMGEIPMFDYYASIDSKWYPDFIYKELSEFLQDNDAHCEFNDPGTVFIFID